MGVARRYKHACVLEIPIAAQPPRMEQITTIWHWVSDDWVGIPYILFLTTHKMK